MGWFLIALVVLWVAACWWFSWLVCCRELPPPYMDTRTATCCGSVVWRGGRCECGQLDRTGEPRASKRQLERGYF